MNIGEARYICLAVSLFTMLPMSIFAQTDRLYPNVIGQQLTTTTLLAEELGIELVIDRKNAPGRKDRVLDQIPSDDTPINVNARMYLSVADGLVIPKVTEKDVDVVKAELESSGFTVNVTRQPLENVPQNIVGFSIPHERTRIDPANEAVFLIASSQHLIRVPTNLVGKKVEEAKQFADLKFETNIRFSSGTLCDTPAVYHYFVTESDPKAGTLVPFGSIVTLKHRSVKVRDAQRHCNDEGVAF